MTHPAVIDRQEMAQHLQAHLLSALAHRRHQLGLSQAELGERIGRARMTVQRAEAEGAGTSMTTFVELAVGLGLTPVLKEDRGAGELDVAQMLPQDIVHRGLHHNRTKHDLSWRDRQREAALAKSWEAVNERRPVGLSPVMDHLVPSHTQEQATAVATAIQWLGSEVGFDFLARALALAGYDVVEQQPQTKAPRNTKTSAQGR